MIRKGDAQWWVLEAKKHPESAPAIIEELAKRLAELDAENERLRDEVVQVQRRAPAAPDRSELTALRRQVTALQGLLDEETVPEPAWVKQPPDMEAGTRYFVGIAVVDNILEEQQGRSLAIKNAAEQIAGSIATTVQSSTAMAESRKGPAQHGKDKVWTEIYSRVSARANAIVTEMTPVEYYSERWGLRERFLGRSFRRYKYFALVSYPEEEYNRLLVTIREGTP